MNTKTTAKLFIPRGDVFHLDFANYQFDARFENVRKIMRDRRYTAGETKTAYRVINHWDQLGLLPEGVQGNDGGWRKFTLPEVVWLRVIARMRDFGVPLEKIALAKAGVMKWNEKHEQYPYFEYYVAKAWFSTADPYVIMLNDGEAEVAAMSEIELAKLFSSFDGLLISLKAVFKDIGIDPTDADILRAVSDNEAELLGSIQHEGSKEVRAKIDNRGEITEIESTEVVSQPLAPHKIKNQLQNEKMYGRVVTKYEDGVPKSVQVIKRTRLKK